jgi:O-antigen/teichoic acid export membrane protein
MKVSTLYKFRKLTNSKNLREVSILWFSQIMASISAFFTQFLLVRILSVAEYGAYSTAFSFTGIIASLAGFGVGSYWLRIFGKEGWEGFRWVKKTLFLAFLSIVLSMSLLLLFTLIINFSENTKILLLFFSTIIISQGLATIAYSVYQLEGKYKLLALFQFLTHGLRFFVVLIIYFFKKSLVLIGIGYVLASIILIIFYIPTIYRMYKKQIDLKGHGIAQIDHNKIKEPTLRSVIKNTWPFFFAGVFYLIYYQSNIFLINTLTGEEASGIYNVALTVLTVIYLFPSALYQGFLLPKIHRWAEHDNSKIITIYNLGGKSIILLGLFLMAVLSSSSIWIIPILFGDQFLKAGYILVILSIAIPIRLLGNNFASILVTENNMIKKVYYQGIGALFNICCNLFFINLFGIYGAAITTVLTEIVITILFAYGVNKYNPIVKNYHIKNKIKYAFLYLLSIVAVVSYFFFIYYTRVSLLESLLLLLILFLLFFRMMKVFLKEIEIGLSKVYRNN